MNSDVPVGWTQNPSRWSERVVVIALAVAGFGISLDLSLYQIGVLSDVWEPFFGQGSEIVLHSVISKLLPVPDASLGALAYFVEIILACLGGSSRWRRQPWIVISYGLVIAGLACVSILLVIFQVAYLHAFCTLCLASAAISLTIAVIGAKEVLASLHYLFPEQGLNTE
jgi:uncharacterized membrane protein